MANGRVCTGFSKPYVALYSASQGEITYSSGQILARGVDISVEPGSASDDNKFFADNVAAETSAGTFTSGTLTLTVDGLLAAAEKLIMGLPNADSDGWYTYDDDQSIPYVGIGFIARYMSSGVTTYVPVVLTKCAFQQLPMNAATQGEDIDWQTTQITAQVLRADDAKHSWKKAGLSGQATEAAAEDMIKAVFGIS